MSRVVPDVFPTFAYELCNNYQRFAINIFFF